MWLWNSTPDSREPWLASLDAVAALKLSTIITGHKDPVAPDDNATRVLDQSRRYIEDFDQTVAKSSTPLEVIDAMLAKYPAYGNRYTLFAALLIRGFGVRVPGGAQHLSRSCSHRRAGSGRGVGSGAARRVRCRSARCWAGRWSAW
jgi:hypothetical protein